MNWGHKLFIGFSAFAGMIIFLAIRSFNVRFDMVEKDYYKNETNGYLNLNKRSPNRNFTPSSNVSTILGLVHVSCLKPQSQNPTNQWSNQKIP